MRDLHFLAGGETFVFDRDVVVFWGQDGENRVRCEVSREALDDHFGGDGKDKLEVFRANRRLIEQEAGRKSSRVRQSRMGLSSSGLLSCRLAMKKSSTPISFLRENRQLSNL